MRKRDELTNTSSCLNKARDDEMTFVLLGRDEAAPATILAWIAERIRLGKNQPCDSQIIEARECAQVMDQEREARSGNPGQSLANCPPEVFQMIQYLGSYADRPETLTQSAAFGTLLRRARDMALQFEALKTKPT